MAAKDTSPQSSSSPSLSTSKSAITSSSLPSSPIPLSAKQESEVQDIYQAAVRAKCADQIRRFAECARSYTITINFRCADQKLAMNHCLREHGTQAERDRARHEWFSTIDERRQRRQQEEVERKENERKLKEWWGMDENWQRIDRKLETILPSEKTKKGGG